VTSCSPRYTGLALRAPPAASTRLIAPSVEAIVALGWFAWRAALDMVRTGGGSVPSPLPKFGHLATATIGEVTLIGCYHPSQQNTFTGRLTPAMLDDVFTAANRAISAC
jgi:uracil-DNA glycosylase